LSELAFVLHSWRFQHAVGIDGNAADRALIEEAARIESLRVAEAS
jgi:hypothetical protein